MSPITVDSAVSCHGRLSAPESNYHFFINCQQRNYLSCETLGQNLSLMKHLHLRQYMNEWGYKSEVMTRLYYTFDV